MCCQDIAQELITQVFRRGLRQPPTVEHFVKVAISFGKNFALVRCQIDDTVRDDPVHCAGFHRQILNLTLAELDAAETSSHGVGASFGQHLIGHVHPDHVPVRVNPAGGQKAINTCPAAQVHHRLPGSEIGVGRRVATAKAQVCSLGQSGKLRRRVAR